jgi:hypothetical protein
VFHEFGHYYARWLSEYNPGAHAALMENVQNTYQSDIPWYSSYVQYHLKHSRRSRGEVFVDQLGLAKKFREALQGIDPQDNLAIARLLILQKTFFEAQEQDTGLVIYWVHCKLLWLTSLILV